MKPLGKIITKHLKMLVGILSCIIYLCLLHIFLETILFSDEKVQLSNQVYDLVARYLRRLDQETHKFKLELEADHSGITEILEKREYMKKIRMYLLCIFITFDFMTSQMSLQYDL